jgi:tRNA-dihydrouridine synthase A
MAAEMGVNGDDCSHQTEDGSIYCVQHHECDETKTSDGTVLIKSGDAFTIEDADAHCSKGRQSDNDKSIHIAPMINVTYREFRQLMRILSKRAVIWKEMVVDATVVHTVDLDFYLEYERHNSHPIVCQVGGNDPETLRRATRKVLEYGYDEVNLNMGCPSKLVADRNEFGAVLMKRVDTAELALKTMREAIACFSTLTQRAPSSSSPAPKLSVKCRIGVDDLDSLDDLIALIRRLSNHCNNFYLHARKAVLGGILSPVENRSVPPLNYPRVYDICKAFPDCEFYINGGITNLKSAKDVCFGRPDVVEGHGVPCKICDLENGSCITPPLGPAPSNLRGCMVGRIARDNPCILWDVDRYFYGEAENPCQNRKEVLEQYCAYLETIYPRRCCDRYPGETKKIIDAHFDFEYDYCQLCVELRDTNSPVTTVTVGPSQLTTGRGVMVTSYVMSRSIKPIMNIFFGLPMARQFRRETEQLIRNVEYRNCGPAALIRRALRIVPIQVLEQRFDPAE